MSQSYDLRTEYCALCRTVEMLLHDVSMIECLTVLYGDATGHTIHFTLMTGCKTSAIDDLVTRIPLPVSKEELRASLRAAVDRVYEICAVSARQFGQWLIRSLSPETHEAYLRQSQQAFVTMRLLLDKEVRSVLGVFFDEAMWDKECISIPMLFQIDLDRKSRSYQDEVRQGLVKQTKVIKTAG